MEREDELTKILREVIACTLRQLGGHGRGIEPSENLQKAIQAAEKLVGPKETWGLRL